MHKPICTPFLFFPLSSFSGSEIARTYTHSHVYAQVRFHALA